MSWWQCLHLKSLKGRTDFCRQDFTSTFFFSALSHIWSSPCWVQTAQNTSRSTEESVIRNFRMIMQYFAKQILWFYLPDLHQRKWIKCLFILIYIFSDLRFFRVNFLSLFVAVSFPPSPSLPLPLPPSLPPSQSWQSILSLLLYHSHFGRLPKGRGKEKKKNVLSPDRKLILVICIKNIKRHRHEKRIWGDTLIKHSG